MTWVKIYRDIFSSNSFEEEKYSKREAWIWMICAAVWEDCQVPFNGDFIPLKRGQFSHSNSFLAKKFGWAINTIRLFLKTLEADTMIDTATDMGQTVVTICNYSSYQDVLNKADTAADTAADRKKKNTRSKEKKDNQPTAEITKNPDDEKVIFTGTVVRLTRADWNKWKSEFGLDDKQQAALLDERDEFLSKLEQSDNRRSRWWIPTRKWLGQEAENLRNSQRNRK